MRRTGSFLVVLLVAILLAGGAGATGAAEAGKPSVPTAKSLIDHKYSSVTATGNPVLKGRTIRVEFFRASMFSGEAKKPMLRVAAGCNGWAVKFRIRRGRLTTYGLTDSSAVGCPRDPDPWIQRQFRKGLKASKFGKRLVLTRPAAGVRFVFLEMEGVPRVKPGKVDEEPDPEPRNTVPATKEDVDGKSYELIATIGKKLGQGLRLSFWDATRTDGSGELAPVSLLSFYAGCNHMAGQYGVEDGVLSLTEVNTTDMWCQNTNDAWIYKFLSSAPEIGLDGTDLVIRKNGVEIVLEQTGS